jgi:hypothetical protein
LALAQRSPVWIDMKLAADASVWRQPWDATDADDVDWSAMEDLSRLLGFGLPTGDRWPADPVLTALHRLPVLNELAVLRWLMDEFEVCAAERAPYPLSV